MSARDVPERIRGDEDGQTEGEADQELLAGVVGTARREDRADPEEEQHERADQLGDRGAEHGRRVAFHRLAAVHRGRSRVQRTRSRRSGHVQGHIPLRKS
jgi:hypothetical protein